MFASHNEMTPKTMEELTLLAKKFQNLIETEEEYATILIKETTAIQRSVEIANC